MANKSNKTIYYQYRKEKELTREEACELLEGISVDRLERIENGRANPDPYEVTQMAKGYKSMQLCNYYCTHDCSIGREYVQEIQIKEGLSQIVLETLNSLNIMSDKKNRFIEIAVDGKITGDELKDFIQIQNELNKISMTIDSLKLWTEQMKANGSIDEEEYLRAKEEIQSC